MNPLDRTWPNLKPKFSLNLNLNLNPDKKTPFTLPISSSKISLIFYIYLYLTSNRGWDLLPRKGGREDTSIILIYLPISSTPR